MKALIGKVLWWLALSATGLLVSWSSLSQAETIAWTETVPAAGQVVSNVAAAAAAAAAPAQAALPPELQGMQSELEALVRARSAVSDEGGQAGGAAAPRVEIVLGRLDPRLKLAPCEKVRAYLPEGSRLWGRTRVGLRCERGAVKWNVYWPLTVKVWAPAVVAAAPIKPGTVLSAGDLKVVESDLAGSTSPAILRPEDVIGRTMLRGLDAGQGLRQGDLRVRRWFAAGEPVNVLVKGKGFAVAAAGVAISHGDEGGQCARIRVENGRVLCGQPVGERRVEVTL
jgi:flagella basal body P-ring formation protein FlgA